MVVKKKKKKKAPKVLVCKTYNFLDVYCFSERDSDYKITSVSKAPEEK